MPETIEFVIPEERDNTISELQKEIERLNAKVESARWDIKRILVGDYESICEFCVHDNCCYRLTGKRCHRDSQWRGYR